MRNPKKSSGSEVADVQMIDRFATTPGVWITITGAAYYASYYNQLAEIGLKPSWVTALAFIEQFDGITQSELGRRLKINRASAMSLSNSLNDANLIKKVQQAKLNQVALHLTYAGKIKLDEACAMEQQITAEVFASMSEDEVLDITNALKRIHSRLSSDSSSDD